jgi:hypothetical protein
MAEIEHLDVTGEPFARDLVVNRMMRVVAFLKQARDGNADLLGIRFRLKRSRRQSKGDDDRQQGQRRTTKNFHKMGKKARRIKLESKVRGRRYAPPMKGETTTAR